jgi:hypothetical protein
VALDPVDVPPGQVGSAARRLGGPDERGVPAEPETFTYLAEQFIADLA